MKLAAWLETRLPGCLLWYGDDSSCILYPFNIASRKDQIAYFEQFGWEPYQRGQSDRCTR